MIKNYIINCIKRAFLYQFMIAFSVFRLLDAYKFHTDFLKKLNELVTSLHLNPIMLKVLPDNTEILYKGFLITIIVLAALSILGIRFFQFIAGLACIIIAFIYHNPITEFRGKIIETQADYFPSFTCLLFISLGLGIIANAFSCSNCEKISEVNKKTEMEMADQNLREEKPISDKKKKKII